MFAAQVFAHHEPPMVRVDAQAEQQVRQTIERQLQAFQAGDAAAAFSIAAPAIQRKFRTPEVFLSMVRQGYPVIYRPASVTFLRLEKLGESTWRQRVEMGDDDGRIWVMDYSLSPDAQGRWRINGVRQARTNGSLI